MIKIPTIIVVALFLVTACAGGTSPTDLRLAADQSKGVAQILADDVRTVPDQYRPLRVCLFATMGIELMTDRVRLFDPSRAADVLGRLFALQGAVDTAREASADWMNADMADVTFVLAGLLVETGKEKAAGLLSRGLSIGAAFEGVRRAAATTAKGAAMLRDVDAMMVGLEFGQRDEESVWKACEARAEKNRITLQALTGARR